MRRASLCFVTAGVMLLGAAADEPAIPGFAQATDSPRPDPEPRQSGPEGVRWGLFRGHVFFNGPRPEPGIVADPEVKITRRDHRGVAIADTPPRRLPDHELIARRGAPIRSERLLIDPESNGVRNALVFLVSPTAVLDTARKIAPRSVQFRADRGVFVPHVLAAMQGAEILVSTEDPATYQVRAGLPKSEFVVEERDRRSDRPRILDLVGGMNVLFGTFQGGRRVSLSVRTKGEKKPRPIPVAEDIHPWMSAWWLILDHPYFAVTDERGAFEIRDVPSGPQRVVVWQESVGRNGKVFEGEVVIQGGDATVKDFPIETGQVADDLRVYFR
jgi:hypothetical protein